MLDDLRSTLVFEGSPQAAKITLKMMIATPVRLLLRHGVARAGSRIAHR